MWDSLIRGMSAAALRYSPAAPAAAARDCTDTPQEQQEALASAAETEETAAAAHPGETGRRQDSLLRLREALRHSRTTSSLYKTSASSSQMLHEDTEEVEDTEETESVAETEGRGHATPERQEALPEVSSQTAAAAAEGAAAAAAAEWPEETPEEDEWSNDPEEGEGGSAGLEAEGGEVYFPASRETVPEAEMDAAAAGARSSSRSSSTDRDVVSRGKPTSARPSSLLHSRLKFMARSLTIGPQQLQQQQQRQKADEVQLEVEQQLTDEVLLHLQSKGSGSSSMSTRDAAASAAGGSRGEAGDVPAGATAAAAAEAQEQGIEGLPDFLSLLKADTAPCCDAPLPAHGIPSLPVEAAAAAGAAATTTGRVCLFNDPDKNAPVDHVLLVIHGIGCGSQHELKQQEQLRHSIRCINSLWFWKKPISVHVLAINWKMCIVEAQEHLFQSIGISSMYEMRRLLSLTAGDLLFFMTPRFGDFIMQHVALQLNRAYYKLRHHPSGRFANSTFSLLGYSLGSVMAYELLSGKTYRPTHHKSAEDVPKLRFSAKCLFLLGGCLPAFLLLNSPEILKTGLQLPPQLEVYNLFHPCDPVAFRLEKLVYPHLKEVPPPVLLAYWRSNGLQDWYKWDLNVQQARDLVTSNLSNLTASVLSWWRRDSPSTAAKSLLAANAAAASAASQKRERSLEEQQEEEEKQKQQNGNDASAPALSRNEDSSRGSDGQLRDLRNFKSRLQSVSSQRRLQQFQTTHDPRSLARSSSSSTMSSSNSSSYAYEDDSFFQVASWFRLGPKMQREDAAAAAAAAKRFRAASAAADATAFVKQPSGINRQLRKLTLQDRISRRPRVQTHQEIAAGAETEGCPSPPRQQSSSLRAMLRERQKSTNSYEYFTANDEQGAVPAVYGDTQRAVLQLEAVNALKEDHHMSARLDFQLQEDAAEHYLSSLAILNSHFNYFKLKDVAFFILKCLSGKNPLISYTDHLRLLEAAAKKAADHAAKEGRLEEQQRQLEEAAALAERVKTFEAALLKPRSKKQHRT